MGGSVGGLLAKDNSSLSASADNVSVIVNAEANQKGSVTAKGVYFTGNSLQLDASEEINIGVTIKPSAVTNSSSYAAGIEDFFYWIYAGTATFMLLYELNDGGVRMYAVAGVFAGMILYDKIVSRFLFAALKKAGKWFKIKRNR